MTPTGPHEMRAQLLRFAEAIPNLYRQERERATALEMVLGELHHAYISTMETLAHLVEARDGLPIRPSLVTAPGSSSNPRS